LKGRLEGCCKSSTKEGILSRDRNLNIYATILHKYKTEKEVAGGNFFSHIDML